MSKPMRILSDIIEGELIVAIVQSGEDLHAKCRPGCITLGPDMIKLEDCPPLEELSPQFPLPKARA